MEQKPPRDLLGELFGEAVPGLQLFCLERWQSLHETEAKVQLSESGVHPLTLAELEEYGVDLGELRRLELGYGWTRGSPRLRERIAQLYGEAVEPEGVVAASGSAEANLVTAISIVSPGDTVVVDMPNYMQLPGLLKWLGAKVVYLWRRPPTWSFPLGEAVEILRRTKPKALFVTDPNNPTGTYMSWKEMEELVVEAERRGTLLVFDEVYWGSELGDPRPSILEVAGPERAVSVSGLSKVYGLPGLRIGWAAGSKEVAERMWSVKDYTTIAPSRLSDYVASIVLEPGNARRLRERARSIVGRNLETLRSRLEARSGVLEPFWPRAGAYILARVPWSRDTLALSYTLYVDHGILVNPGECFELPGHLRIGVGQKPDEFSVNVEELLAVLEKLRSG